eukprot:1159023-Pelagomonas_calceolata.AAC.1
MSFGASARLPPFAQPAISHPWFPTPHLTLNTSLSASLISTPHLTLTTSLSLNTSPHTTPRSHSTFFLTSTPLSLSTPLTSLSTTTGLTSALAYMPPVAFVHAAPQLPLYVPTFLTTPCLTLYKSLPLKTSRFTLDT